MNIRRAVIEDAENLLNTLLLIDRETKYMLFEPNERTNDVELAKRIIKQSDESNSLILVAEENNDIVGFLSAIRGVQNRTKHTAHVVVGVKKAFQGKGIGKRLFEELDLWAKETNIKRLELTVMINNVAAKNLYKGNEFEIEGLKKSSIFIDGKYIDEYYMSKLYQ